MTVAVIIVTHNSVDVLPLCIKCLLEQTHAVSHTVIVDSGSDNTGYLDEYRSTSGISIVERPNLGFSQSNNAGTATVIDSSDVIVYLNPDAYMPHDFIEKSLRILSSDPHRHTGILGPKLYRFDLKNNQQTRILDSTGHCQKWYGRWYDRGKGDVDAGQFDTGENGEDVPALTGALLVCRKSALEQSKRSEHEYFCNRFFMNKEDIELCLRVHRKGWDIRYSSQLFAYHCRGWQRRSKMPRWARLQSAKNEMFVNMHLGPVKSLYGLLKYVCALLGI